MVKKADPMGHYRHLGVECNASQRRIKAAYRKLLRRHNRQPDTDIESVDHTDSADFEKIQTAYKALRDPVARARYDNWAKATSDIPRRNAGLSRPPHVYQSGNSSKKAMRMRPFTFSYPRKPIYAAAAPGFDESRESRLPAPSSPMQMEYGQSTYGHGYDPLYVVNFRVYGPTTNMSSLDWFSSIPSLDTFDTATANFWNSSHHEVAWNSVQRTPLGPLYMETVEAREREAAEAHKRSVGTVSRDRHGAEVAHIRYLAQGREDEATSATLF